MLLLDQDGFHRLDRGQEIRDQVPCIAAISAGEDLACVGANVDPAGIERVRTHAMTQHAQAHAWARGQPFGDLLPLLAAILCAVDAELLAYIVAPFRIFHHDESVRHALFLLCVDLLFYWNDAL